MTSQQISVNLFSFIFCGIYFAWSCRDLGVKQAIKDFVLAVLIAIGINHIVHSILVVMK